MVQCRAEQLLLQLSQITDQDIFELLQQLHHPMLCPQCQPQPKPPSTLLQPDTGSSQSHLPAISGPTEAGGPGGAEGPAGAEGPVGDGPE